MFCLSKKLLIEVRDRLLIERQFVFDQEPNALYIQFTHLKPFRYCCKKLEKFFKPSGDRVTADIKNARICINAYGPQDFMITIKEKVIKYFTKYIQVIFVFL